MGAQAAGSRRIARAHKVRVDDLLVSRGLAQSRDDALRAIVAGEVSLSDRLATSAGEMVPSDEPVRRRDAHRRFVSRGGEKLAFALREFAFDPAGMRCIDVGASTGGFTDCLLKAGAASVVALDVGYGDLAWRLRTDPRVTPIERTNIRDADLAALGAPFDLAVADVSFISLEKVLPSVKEALGQGASLITLIKPQFEAPKNLIGDKGVVLDAQTHIMVVERILRLAAGLGLAPRGLTPSPIRGAQGNIEFLLLCERDGECAQIDVRDTVNRAHSAL